MRTHKHNGINKRHSILQQHSNINAQKYHNEELQPSEKQYLQGIKPKPAKQNKILKTAKKEFLKEKKKKNVSLGDLQKLKKVDESKFAPIIETKDEGEFVLVPIDNDGYLNIDLSIIKQNGVRVSFNRIEGTKKRNVNLQINK